MAQTETRLPGEPGGYALVFKLDAPIRIKPGRLGTVELPGGHYLYMGSALSGMAPRLARHLRRRKNRHWHIDALTSVVRADQIWWAVTDIRLECDWTAIAQADPKSKIPATGFGSSDCRCESHLIWLETADTLERVWQRIVNTSPSVNRLTVPARLSNRFLNPA